MNQENIRSRNIWRLWITATTCGAVVGALIAAILFPTPNYPIGFSVCLALPFATGQWLAMHRFLKSIKSSKKQEYIWLLITLLGLIVTMLPFWNGSMDAFLNGMGISIDVIIRYVLGSVFLGTTQWLFLAWIFGFRSTWIWIPLTTFGLILGTLFFFVIALLFYLILGLLMVLTLFMIFDWPLFSIFTSFFTKGLWFITFALGISSLQGYFLNRLYLARSNKSMGVNQ